MIEKNDVIGLIKPQTDAHTLGISNLQQYLEECGNKVVVSNQKISTAVEKISNSNNSAIIKEWIILNQISHIGFSYRLDPQQALDIFARLVYQLDTDKRFSPQAGGRIKNIFFAGLPDACSFVENKYKNRFKVFYGDETPVETLEKLGIPSHRISNELKTGSVYDDIRLKFGKKIVEREEYKQIEPYKQLNYPDFGTRKDSLIKRLNTAKKNNRLPLFRTHIGPYLPNKDNAIKLFVSWLNSLSQTGYLDIVSIGSSQLSQSNFGEDWKDKPNGGGVPINSSADFNLLYEASRPMLIRSYSGTKNIVQMAGILENSINIAWHALSLWWFNQLDGRGPLTLKQGLSEHIETIKYIASTGKPFEANVPHHFAFRGADDITYIVSEYISAKLAKKCGIKYFIFQNMLNTPKATWGIQDLAKARTIFKLLKTLEDNNFKIIYQPRAGLDYFSPNIEKAKAQLAAVTAMMTDVCDKPPEIIHVVNYSEAAYLADPLVVNESIQITQQSLKDYSVFKKKNDVDEILRTSDISDREEELYEYSIKLINDIEKTIFDLYTPSGLHTLFEKGYFPVPYLWNCRDEYKNAVNWKTKVINGSTFLVDCNQQKMSIEKRLEKIHSFNK